MGYLELSTVKAASEKSRQMKKIIDGKHEHRVRRRESNGYVAFEVTWPT
jgi:hypothetical protein